MTDAGTSDARSRGERASAEHDWTAASFAPAVPEALAQPAIVRVRYDQVDGDPFNIRDSLPAVTRLAWSIYQHGLLENLLVTELEPAERKDGRVYQLRAGSRRFEAIRRLIEEGVEPPPGHPDRKEGITWRWAPDHPISVLVLGSHGHYEHLLENFERENPHPWELGRRLNEIMSAGVPSRELGPRLGRSHGWVARYAHIGRGLAPELVELIRKERAEVRLGELSQLAAMRDEYGDPDGPRQVAAFQARRQKRRRRSQRVDPQSFRATLKRLQYLRADMPVPALIRPVVSAVIDYVQGGTRPEFRALELELFERLRTYDPHTVTEE